MATPLIDIALLEFNNNISIDNQLPYEFNKN